MKEAATKEKEAPTKEDPVETAEQPKPGTALTAYDFGDDAGKGLQNITRDEYAIPFLIILDGKSRHVKPAAAGGVTGAAAGMIMNTATQELFPGDKGITFVPVHRDHKYTEWIPKNEDGSGGGFVGIRGLEDPLITKLTGGKKVFGKLKTSEGHELLETFELYGLYLADGVGFPAVVSFASTQIKKYTTFIPRVTGLWYPTKEGGKINPPFWAHAWQLQTTWEKKGKVHEGYGWKIIPAAETEAYKVRKPNYPPLIPKSDPLYAQAAQLYDSISTGAVTVKRETAEQEADEEIPF